MRHPHRGSALAALLLLASCSGSGAPAASGRPAGPGASAPSTASVTSTPSVAPVPDLSAATIYSGTAPDLSGYDPKRLRLVVVTGDVIPARLVEHGLRRLGDYAYPFRATTDLLHSGDLTVVDLEAPLIPDCPDQTTGFTFCGDARIADGMAQAGVTMAGLANNHITNYGTQGLSQTRDLLRSKGITVATAGTPGVRDVRGLRFALVAVNLVGARLDAAALRREIAQARAEADVVMVEYHWGREYETFPFPAPGIAPDDPRQVGRTTVDDGADLVIGNHPHCVQGSELYAGRLITYAHGNFLFDQDWSVGTQESVVGKYWFYDRTLVAVRYVPVRIVNNLQPRPLDPSSGEGRAILDRMVRSSRELLGLTPPVLDGPGRNDACP